MAQIKVLIGDRVVIDAPLEGANLMAYAAAGNALSEVVCDVYDLENPDSDSYVQFTTNVNLKRYTKRELADRSLMKARQAAP